MSTGPAHRVHSAVVEYGFPQGHLGHLTDDEEAAFENFKVLCAEKGYYTPAGGADAKASHDDATMLRFLRARRFVPSDAFVQFKDTEDWRKANQLDELYETIDLEQYEETRRLYPQWTGRRDRRGIPIYVYEVKHLNAKTMHAYEKSAKDTKSKAQIEGTVSPKLLRLFALYENLTRFVMPLSTALTDREHPATPITQSNNIVDISGVGLKQFWNLRTHMQDASTLATAHYPETLDRIFIIGAPAFFPTVWGWIKKWFDPITTSKIFIIPHSEVKTTLETFIDPANIPVKYGGQLEYTFGEQPLLDPAINEIMEWEDGVSNFPEGPKFWIEQENADKFKCIGVGSMEEKVRREEIGTVTRVFQPATDWPSNVERGFGSELLNIPTAANSTNHLESTATPVAAAETAAANNSGVAQVEQLSNRSDPASVSKKSEPERLVTATEGGQALKLDDTPRLSEKIVEPVFQEKFQPTVVPTMNKV